MTQVNISVRREQFYRAFARVHSRLLVRTGGRPVHLTPRLRCLVLETSSQRSGLPHRVVVGYMPDGDDFVVLASNFGRDRPPLWWQNLRVRPDASVWVAGRQVPVRARLLAGAEREAMLARAIAHNKQWRGYAASMDRELPVVRLERVVPGQERDVGQ